MRYAGQGHEIALSIPAGRMTTAHTASLRKEFETEYARLFARHIPGAAIEIMSWVVIATTSAARPPRLPEPSLKDGPKPVATRAVFDAGLAKRIDVPVYERGHLVPGAKVRTLPCRRSGHVDIRVAEFFASRRRRPRPRHDDERLTLGSRGALRGALICMA